MPAYRNLWQELCSYENLLIAFKKARKRKMLKKYVIEFEADLQNNLLQLQKELISQEYTPKPLCTFIINDPKTRKISKSDFRDRIVHHAICNIIEPLFERAFICDSFANRKGKGTLNAIERFDYFKRKASRNNMRKCFVLKADIKHYFETVKHSILMQIINKKLKDPKVLSLIKAILQNYETKLPGKGMPLGNLTSQFFANVYLNELDYFVKQNLKARYYVRYVDDFVIFHHNKNILTGFQREINAFLSQSLAIELHPDKSKITPLNRGVSFLGFRIFYQHKLLKKSNIRKINKKFQAFQKDYFAGKIGYDAIYDSVEGWLTYAKHANTYRLREKFMLRVEQEFPNEISTKEINRLEKDFGSGNFESMQIKSQQTL